MEENAALFGAMQAGVGGACVCACVCARGASCHSRVLFSAASVSACGERNGEVLKGGAAADLRQPSESHYVTLTARGRSRRGINKPSAEP